MANILIVDDSPSMRQFVEMAVKVGMHTTDSAENGEQGIELLKSNEYDAIITDMNMPIMSGIDFTKTLRKLPAYKFTPVIMLSTESGSSSKKLGKDVGVTGWLIMPFNPDALLKIIDKIT